MKSYFLEYYFCVAMCCINFDYFAYYAIDEKEKEKYLSLINDYYQNHPFDPVQANNNDKNNNNVNNNLINNINVNVNINNDNANSHNII